MQAASTATSQECHSRNASVPMRTRRLPAMSERDLTINCSTCSTSLVTRRSMSPVRRRLWNASERCWRCAYTVTRTL